MKVTAVFIALLGLAAAEVILGDGGAYSYTLDNSAPAPAPAAEPAPEPKKEPEPMPEPAYPGYYYGLISADCKPGRIPYPYRLIDSKPMDYAPLYSNIVSSPASEGSNSAYSYKIINSASGISAYYALPSVEYNYSPSYSYRIVSEPDSAEPKPLSSYIPSTVYNWYSGLPSLPNLSQYLPQLAQYRNPEYAYRFYYPQANAVESEVTVEEDKVDEVKVDEVMKDEVSSTYSYKQL